MNGYLEYISVYCSHIEGIYKNGGVFKLQRHHRKQFYIRLAYASPHTHTKYPFSKPQSTIQWHNRSQFQLRFSYAPSTTPLQKRTHSYTNTTAIYDWLLFLFHKLHSNNFIFADNVCIFYIETSSYKYSQLYLVMAKHLMLTQFSMEDLFRVRLVLKS